MGLRELFHPRIERLQATGNIAKLIGALGYGAHSTSNYAAASVRQRAATALGELRDPLAVEPLIQRLKDEFERVRAEAARALGEIGDVRSTDALVSAMWDHDPYVRIEIGRSLVKLGDERGFEPLLVLLTRQGEHGRSVAARALGELGDERAIGPLVSVLGDRDHELGRSAEDVLLERGWRDATEIRRARLGEACLHEKVFANELCRDCGSPLARCTKCEGWFHLRETQDCNTYP